MRKRALLLLSILLVLSVNLLAFSSEEVFHSFTGNGDGGQPIAGLVADKAGNLYGTAYYGGTAGYGVVFKLDTHGAETVLHNFTGTPDGAYPYAGLIRGANGNLYGTTRYGGKFGWGTVFRVNASGKEKVLYNFSGGIDGGNPTAALYLDSAGNLLGTSTEFAARFGNVFKLDKLGNETVLYTFTGGADGNYPNAGLVQDSTGNLYGTTYYGGAFGYGTVFRLDTNGHETVLHSFTGGTDGRYPLAGLLWDSAGNLHSTTEQGGDFGYGTVFMLKPTGELTLRHSFSNSDGAYPTRGLIWDAAGNLYGTTSRGGAFQVGTVFRLDATDQVTTLYTFTGAADGAVPYSDLIRDVAGNLYGTTVYGGAFGNGVVFKIAPSVIPFLNFPLLNRTARSARINTVFDHSSVHQYCADGVVTSYDGEVGRQEYGSSLVASYKCGLTMMKNQLFGFAQLSGDAFSINGQYDGGGDKFHLFYDGHPGYDFKTVDQGSDGRIPVLAAAGGTVVCVNLAVSPRAPCTEGPGEIKINHGNGYFTIYLHLGTSLVQAGDSVVSLRQIGISGDTGIPGSPHLHFEVRQGTANGKCPGDKCFPVDPYGWSGPGSDPYVRAVNVNLWK